MLTEPLSRNASTDGRVYHLSRFQEESDERVVELQSMVQSASHTEAEIQQMYDLLQDLEISMSNSQQRQKEVRPGRRRCACRGRKRGAEFLLNV